MGTVDELMAGNRRYAATFRHGHLPAPPARRLAVLTCMDARLRPYALLNLSPGDAHVLRNAGGRVTEDAVRSLIVSTHQLGTRTILVVQHTGCGMIGLSNEALHDELAAGTGADASHVDFLPITDLRASVRGDVEQIRANPFLPPDLEVSGCVYDVATGLLTPVDDG